MSKKILVNRNNSDNSDNRERKIAYFITIYH